jgi:dienelactone hydrolase
MMKLILSFVAIFVLVAIITGCSVIQELFESPDFIKPTGPYSVGTTLLEVIDDSRMETMAPEYEGSRRFPVRAFYPAVQGATGEYLPAMDARMNAALAEAYGFPGSKGDPEPSNSIVEAEAADGPFPVILFSHGAYSFNTQNLSTCEELASQGYVVLAISHTYEALLSLFPEDEAIPIGDLNAMRESMKITRKEAREYRAAIEILTGEANARKQAAALRALGDGYLGEVKPLLDVRLADVDTILAQLREWNLDSKLAGVLDEARIGMFGHSLGGMTTFYACSNKDTAIRAGLAFDVPVPVFDGVEPVLMRPFAFFDSTRSAIPKAGKIDMTGVGRYFATTSDQPIHGLSFMGTSHYNFSDFNFMPLIIRLTGMLGPVDGPHMADMLRRSVVEYFDWAFGDGDGDPFAGVVASYPEMHRVEY